MRWRWRGRGPATCWPPALYSATSTSQPQEEVGVGASVCLSVRVHTYDLQSLFDAICFHVLCSVDVTGGFRKDAPSDLLPSLERLQQALLQEEEDDSSVSHGESKGVGNNRDSSGEDRRPSSTLQQLRTVVNSLLELQQQPVEAT